MRFKHYAHIDDKGNLNLSNKDVFKNELQKFRGKRVFITVDEEKPMRSNEQNKYYWGVALKLISDHTGYTEDEVHEIMLNKFSLKKEIIIGDETHIIKGRSHNMKTDEFEKYLEDIRRFAAEKLNTIIPLPNEILIEE